MDIEPEDDDVTLVSAILEEKEDSMSVFPFVCGICQEKFSRLHSFFEHISVFHHEIADSLHCCKFSEEEKDLFTLYTCGICYTQYPTLCTLYDHLVQKEEVHDFIFQSSDQTVYGYHSDSDIETFHNKSRCNEYSASLKTDDDEAAECIESDTTKVQSGINKVRKQIQKEANKQTTGLSVANCVVSRRNRRGNTVKEDIDDYENVRLKLNKIKECGAENMQDLAYDSDVDLGENCNDRLPGKTCPYMELNHSAVGNKSVTASFNADRISSVTKEVTHKRIVHADGNRANKKFKAVDRDEKICRKLKETIGDNRRGTKKLISRQNTLFPCEVCGALLRFRVLNRHRKTHEIRTLKCSFCDNMYSAKSDLDVHVRQVHVAEKNYKCEECGKSFAAWPYLRQHRQTHIKTNAEQCPKCPKILKHKAQLRKHLLLHSDEKRHNCQLCGRPFMFKYSLTEHLKSHSSERKFSCKTCHKTFKTKQAVTKHSLLHLPPQHVCHICGKAFVQRYNMQAHVKLHGAQNE